MSRPFCTRRRATGRRGYVMLIALLLIAVLAVIGATTLSMAGVDERIAYHNRKHMMVLNTAAAGIEHARFALETENPLSEGFDTGADTGNVLVSRTESEGDFGGTSYAQNLGAYRVEATYLRCGSPPPGYSAELGGAHFRSDYWMLRSTARMLDAAGREVNETQATTGAMVRKVVRGNCRIR